MHCRTPLRYVFACCLLLVLGTQATAATDSERLLPNTTKGFLSVGDIDRFRADWAKTQLGQLMADPIMKPFVEDFRQQLQKKWTKTHQKLGITWEDLEGVPAGEVAIGLIQPNKSEAGFVLLVDITGHQKETDVLLEKIAKNLAAQQATRTKTDVRGSKVTVFNIPKREERPAQQAYYCIKDNRLIAADNLKVLEGILGRFDGKAKDSLATLPAFSSVTERCQTAAGEMRPHARWFVEPFGYVEAMRTASPDRQRRKGRDMLKILQSTGFTAIQGAGGYIHLAVDKFEMLHQTFVYAPAIKPGDDRYELSANVLDFPNGGDFKPQLWVPREVATYASINLKPQKAFDASKSLVDEMVGDGGTFEEIITSVATDPNGPQINIRTDLVAHLSDRATVISDYVLPITPKSERMLVAIEAKDPAILTATVQKWMESDPDAKRREFSGHVIWEMVTEEVDVPMITIENQPALGPDKVEAEEEEHPKEFPNSAATVAHGQLLWCTHIDFLKKVLADMDSETREQLATSNEYVIVKAQLDRLSGGKACAQSFSRTDEEYRAVYELIRTGRMPEAETILGKILNSVLGEGKEGVPRNQRINGSHLPDYEAVRRYFGPAGMTAVSEETGWYITGFMLNKETQ